jgi:hypothetical protein
MKCASAAAWGNSLRFISFSKCCASPRVAHADRAHAEGDAARDKLFRDRDDADDHGGLAEDQPLPRALPRVRLLIALHALKIARQRDHREKRELRHLRP